MRTPVVVIDTNVVVAGLLTVDKESPTAQILDGMLAAKVSYLLSVDLLAEYREVLLREPIRKVHQLSDDEIDRILTETALNGIVVEPEASGSSSPDAGDQHLWDLLAARPGAVLVTGDRRLVNEPPIQVSVVLPRTLVEMASWIQEEYGDKEI